MSSDDTEDLKAGIFPAKMYDMRVPKGRIGNLVVRIWDKVRDCSGESCELFDSCPYFQSDEKKAKARETNNLGACKVEQKYLYSIFDPFFTLLSKVPDEFVMQWVGMHIIPMYHDLVQLKMEKAKLKNMMYYDAKGVQHIHPVYDQMLKTHKEILSAWKTTGLLKIAQAAGYFEAGGKIDPSEGDGDKALNGDSSGYEAMSSGLE